MKSKIIRLNLLFSLLFIVHIHAQYKQINIFPNDTSFLLINKLVQNYKPNFVLDYNQARVKMYTEIYNHQDSVSCIYTKHALYLNPASSDPIGYLIKNGDPNGINCEHTFPQSKGAEVGNARSDMHHLFPARAAANEARSNFPFGEINDNKTQLWLYKSLSQSNKPNLMIDEYSESIDGMFEPREDYKGNIARAVFYFFTMYELHADRNFFELMKPTLCAWHINDPVDSLEWERTFQIANYQDEKPNPFVLDCSLAKRSYCSNFQSCQKIVTNHDVAFFDINIQPNPFHDELILILNDIPNDCDIQILNLVGNTVIEQSLLKNQIRVHISTDKLNPGYYLIYLKNGNIVLQRSVLIKV